MANPVNPPAGIAVVAVAFDEQTPALMKTSISLARRFGMELCFVHAVPSNDELLAFDYSSSMSVYPLAALPTDEEVIGEATAKLDALLADFPADIRLAKVVKAGQTIPLVVAEAVARRASLIVSACDPRGYGALMQGVSVSIGLMHEAPMPVLVVSENCPVDFAKLGCKILLADDLQGSTSEAARKAYELATRLGHGTAVRHVHVHGDFRELLKDSWIETRQEALALLTMQKPTEALNAEIVREYERRQGLMAGQGQPWRSAAEAAGVQVTLDLRTGNPAKELHRATTDFSPDLIVFGRHQVFRARPFLVGRMPLRAMLKETRAVLVVPPAADLYARLPFPAEVKTQGGKT